RVAIKIGGEPRGQDRHTIWAELSGWTLGRSLFLRPKRRWAGLMATQTAIIHSGATACRPSGDLARGGGVRTGGWRGVGRGCRSLQPEVARRGSGSPTRGAGMGEARRGREGREARDGRGAERTRRRMGEARSGREGGEAGAGADRHVVWAELSGWT